MIVDMQSELRSFTYITNLYKCIANYNLKGHQIGRKIGDMLEILTMGAIYRIPALKEHLNTEGKLEGFTSAGHKVEFGFFKNPKTKTGLFGAIECKCVGVEETKLGKNNTVNLKTNAFYTLTLSAQWMASSVTIKIKLLSVFTESALIELSNSSNDRRQKISLKTGEQIKLVIDENGNFLNTTPQGNMLTEIPGIIRICKSVRLESLDSDSCTFALFSYLTGPQTIEKAKQASLVAMDLRKKIDGHWGKEDIEAASKKMTFIHVICEFSHWEEKSRNVIKACIDHNLIVPDAILIKAFETFEKEFGTTDMLDYISKKQFKAESSVQNAIYRILDFFENHIFYDIAQNQYVTFKGSGSDLSIKVL